MKESTETKQTVKKIFLDYLKEHSHRKTTERFAILDEIYSNDGHFDIESLYIKMKNKRYRVSRATLYNTIELLLDCKLVKKHQFGEKNLAQFEKAFKYRQHDHLICLDCKKVFEFCDPRIQNIQNTAGSLLNMNITHHSLNFYGHCNKIRSGENCEHKTKTT